MPFRLLLQRIGDGDPGAHLDLAAGPDRRHAVAHCRSLGATLVRDHQRWTVLQDPTGLVFCLTDRNPHTRLL